MLVDPFLIVVHGAIANAVSNVAADSALSPMGAAGKGLPDPRKEDASPDAEVFVKEGQDLLGEVLIIPGNVQGKAHGGFPPLFR